jgi:hypothetical protein
VISWFQAFAFKWVNLCRYTTVKAALGGLVLAALVAGLYKLKCS